MDLDPDPHSQYGSGSRKGKSKRIHAGPDHQHWFLQLLAWVRTLRNILAGMVWTSSRTMMPHSCSWIHFIVCSASQLRFCKYHSTAECEKLNKVVSFI
jgi:hypothetical protein